MIFRLIFRRFWKDKSGATAIEYGLIAGLIGVVIIGAIQGVGTSISGKFDTVSSSLGGVSGGVSS